MNEYNEEEWVEVFDVEGYLGPEFLAEDSGGYDEYIDDVCTFLIDNYEDRRGV